MEKSTYSFRETNLVLQPVEELRMENKTVMSWSSRKKKKRLFCPKFFLAIVFYLHVYCIE